MRILARVLTTVLGSAVVFFVACTGGGTPAPEGQQPQDGSTPAEDTTPADRAAFSSQDLCNLIFAEDDTPLGLPIRRSESVEEEDECARLFFRDDQNVISRATLYEDSDEASA